MGEARIARKVARANEAQQESNTAAGWHLASQILGGVSLVTQVVAVVLAVTGVGLPAAGVLQIISTATGMASTAIDCVQGGLDGAGKCAGQIGTSVMGGAIGQGYKLGVRGLDVGLDMVKRNNIIIGGAFGIPTGAAWQFWG